MRTQSKIIATAVLVAMCGDASAWRLDYTLEAGVLHSDNINMSPVDAVREDVLIPHLDFGLTHAGASVNVDLGGSLEHRTYLQDTYSSEFRGTFDGRLNWLLVPERFSWTFADNLGLYPVSLRAPDVPGNLQQTNVFSTGPTLRFRFNPALQGQAEARWSQSDAEETGEFDSSRLSGAFRLLHDFSTTRHLSGNLEAEDVDFDDDLLADDYRRYSAYAGYTQALARLDFDLALGYSRIESDSADDSGPLLRASADWRATDRSTFGFGVTWQYSDAATSLAQGGDAFDTGLDGVAVGGALITPDVYRERRLDSSYLYQGVRLNLASTLHASRFRYAQDTLLVDADRDEIGFGVTLGYLLRPLLTLGVSAEATRREFVDSDSTDRDYRYGIYLAQQFARHWSWRADLSRNERNAGSGADSYDENALYLRLIYTH